MNKISLIIPSYGNKQHLINAYESVRRYYKDVEMVLINDGSEDDTFEWLENLSDNNVIKINSKERKGHTYFYDEGMKVASNDIVGIIHADMIIGPNYIENMMKHLEPGKVVCATRVEPPIHPAGLEKIVKDFGMDWNDLKIDKFEQWCLDTQTHEKDNITRGIFAPWILYREDHFAIGGHDQTFAPYGYEDSDIFNRWILAGYEMVQSRDAFVYHLTCRGHRWSKGVGIVNDDYEAQMKRCRRDFIRKWGDWIHNDEYQYPIINPKYDIGFIIKNPTLQLVSELEPWCSNVYIEGHRLASIDLVEYMEKEPSFYNIKSKFKPVLAEVDNDILIELDCTRLTQQDFTNIQKLPAIISNDKELGSGTFTLGNLNITINNIKTYERELIKC